VQVLVQTISNSSRLPVKKQVKNFAELMIEAIMLDMVSFPDAALIKTKI